MLQRLSLLLLIFCLTGLTFGATPHKKKRFKRDGHPVNFGIHLGGSFANQTVLLDDKPVNANNIPRYFATGGLFTDIRFTRRKYIAIDIGYSAKGSRNIPLYSDYFAPEKFQEVSKNHLNYFSSSLLLKHDIIGEFASVCTKGKCYDKFCGVYLLGGVRADLLIGSNNKKLYEQIDATAYSSILGYKAGIGIRGWFWATQLSFNGDFNEAIVIDNSNYKISNYFLDLTFSIFLEK